jgi:cellulose biosynthesis protein BcsQ
MNQTMQNLNAFLQQMNQGQKNPSEKTVPVLQPIIIMPSEKDLQNKNWLQELKEKFIQPNTNAPAANNTGNN